MEQLGQVGATALSYYFAIGFAVGALLLVYGPLCYGLCWLGEKVLPYKLTASKAYGYTLSVLFGAGGIVFMVYAVQFFRI